MTKTKINYDNTVIYKICCKDVNVKDIYVGHTTCFTKRKNKHKNCSNNVNSECYYRNVYQCINKHEGWRNWDMIEVENFSCNDGNEAKARERYYIELLNATLNKCIPLRTKQEYYNDNKEHFKDYYEDNKEQIKKRDKQYRNNNKKELQEKHKQYYIDNKIQLQEKHKQYYNDNKLRHELSLMHQKYINTIT